MAKEKDPYSYIKTLNREIGLIGQGHQKKLYALIPIYAILAGLVPVISVFFTKIVIDLVQQSGDQNQLIVYICSLIGICFVCFGVSTIMETFFEATFLMLRQNEFFKNVDNFHRIDYKNIEDASFQDRFRAGVKATDSDGFGFEHTYISLDRILSMLVSII